MTQLDAAALREKQTLITRLTSGAFVTAMTALGLRLGLFEAMKDAGPVSSVELAAGTGLHERWLREWLRCLGASGLIEYAGNDRFSLSRETAALLAPESPSFAAGRLASFPERMRVFDRLPEAFRTGLGYTWDDRGDEAVLMTENARKAWYQNELVPRALPLIEDVVAKLTQGTKVADFGCGTGLALIELARAFPAGEYHGYDVSRRALTRAQENASGAGATVRFHDSHLDPMPADASFDLVLTFDVLHDLTQPDDAALHVRRALKPSGTWFVLEVDCAPTYEGNLDRGSELAAIGYATSIMNCLASGMAETGGAGLGTLGLPEPLLRDIAARAGFGRFRRVPLQTPHALYEIRP